MRLHNPLNKKNRANSAVLIFRSGRVISLSALFVLMGCFFLIGSAYAQTTYTWDGGGDDTTWTDSDNWDPNGSPTSSDSVIIGNNARVEINSNQEQRAASLLLKDGAHLNITTNNSAQTSLLAGDGSGTHNAIEIQKGTILEVDGGEDKSVAIVSGSEKFYNAGTYTQTAGTGLGDDSGNPLSTSRQIYTPSSTFEFYLDEQYFQVQDYGNLHLNPDPGGNKLVLGDSMKVTSYTQSEGNVAMVEGNTNSEALRIDSTFNVKGGVFRIAQDNEKDTVYFEVGGDVIIDNSATFHNGSGFYFEMFGSQEQTLSPMVDSLETFVVSGDGQKVMQADMVVNYRLVMNGGDINTNGNMLRIGISTTSYGKFDYTEGSIIGKLKKWVDPGRSSLYLPIGNENPDDTTIKHHRHVNLDFSANTPDNGGTLTLEFVPQNPGYDGLPVYEDNDTLKNIGTTGFWNFTAADGMGTDNYEYDIELTAADFVDVFDTTSVHTVIRDDSNSPWELRGKHSASSAIDGDLVIRRDSLTGFSDYTAVGEDDNPLPVEFAGANIRTANSGETAIIEWHTATEKENYRFYIERAYLHKAGKGPAEDTSWTQIGYKEGQGTTSKPQSYSFEDTGLSKAGKYIYRIRQVDYDGTETLLTTLELVVGSPNRTVLADNYPNPFNPATNVPYTLAEGGEVSIKVYNTLGQQVATLVDEYKQAGQYKVRFDASSLTSGIYYIRLNANGYSVNKSITLIK